MTAGPRRPTAASLAWLFVLSLLLRLAGIYLESVLRFGGHVAWRYTEIARNIVAGYGFSDAPGAPNTFEPPIYQYLLSALFALFGESLTSVKVTQAVLDSLTTCVLFLIVRKVLDTRAAYLAAIFYAFYPIAVYSVADVAPETTFSLLLSAAVLALAEAFRSGQIRYYALAGLALGGATLTRATTLYFIPFLALFLLVMRAGFKPVLRLLLVTLSVFVLAIVPWTIRNYVVSKRFIPVAVMGYGEVFLQGSSEEFLVISDKDRNLPILYERLQAKGINRPSHPTPKEWNDYAVRAGWERYREKWRDEGPLGLLRFFAYKFARLWYATESGGNHLMIFLVNAPIVLLAALGLVAAVRAKLPLGPQWPMWAVVLFFIGVHVATLPLQRYMAPVMPYLLAYAAFFITSLGWLRRFRWRAAALEQPRSSG